VPLGVEPAFGTRFTLDDPSLPSATLVEPAATGVPSAAVNAGHEISTTPDPGTAFA